MPLDNLLITVHALMKAVLVLFVLGLAERLALAAFTLFH